MCSYLSDNFWMHRSEWRHLNFSDFSCLPYPIYHHCFSSFIFCLHLFLTISSSSFFSFFSPLFWKIFHWLGFQYKSCSTKQNYSDGSTLETCLPTVKDIIFFPGVVKPFLGVTDALSSKRSFAFVNFTYILVLNSVGLR